MTTHFQKIQALGNRMASNLETMGVSASFNDGGLTLADKILDINKFNDGILFTVDKDVFQKNDSLHLSAMAMDNGKLLNQYIDIKRKTSFENLLTSNLNGFTVTTGTSSISSNGLLVKYEEQVGNNLLTDTIRCDVPMILGGETLLEFDCKAGIDSDTILWSDIDLYGEHANEYHTSMIISSSGDVTFFDYEITLPNNINLNDWLSVRVTINDSEQKLYVNDTLIITTEFIFGSEWVVDERYFYLWGGYGDFYIKNFSIDDEFIIGSGDNGSCSATYTGKGHGETKFVSESSNLQSVPFTLHDDLFYCKGTSGNVNSNWVAETGITSTPDTEGNLLENSTSGGKYYGANLVNTSTGELKDYTTPFCIEFKCISTTGARLFINTSTGGSNIDRNFTSYITGNNHVKMIVRSNDYDLIVDGDTKVSQQSHTLVNPVGVRFVVQANSNLKYKDFEIYPI